MFLGRGCGKKATIEIEPCVIFYVVRISSGFRGAPERCFAKMQLNGTKVSMDVQKAYAHACIFVRLTMFEVFENHYFSVSPLHN